MQKFFRLSPIITVLLFAISLPLSIFAQDEVITYEDPDGLFTLEYPAELDVYPNLFGEADETMIFPNIAFSSSPEVNELSLAGELVPEDGWGIALMFFPEGMFAEMGMGEDMSLGEIAELFIMDGIGDEVEDEAEMEDIMGMMEIEEIELGDGSLAAQVDFKTETEDNLIIFFQPAEGVIALSALLTAPGARTDEQVDQFMAMIDSLEFTGEPDDLMMGMMMSDFEMATYEDAGGFFTVDYPADMVVYPDLAVEFGMPFPSVGFGDSNETIEQSLAAELLDAGQWGIGIVFIPGFLFTEMGMPEDAPLVDLAIAFTAPEPDNAEGALLGDVEEITLDDGTPAIMIEGPGETEDNLVVFFEITDGVYVFTSLLSAPDGQTDEMFDMFWATINSLEFIGTAEDMMMGMGEG